MELNFEYFKGFYKSGEFEKGLKTYFPCIQVARLHGFPQILQVSRHFNNEVSMPFSSLFDENGMEKSICFSIIFYYVCLCNYILYGLGGEELLKDFLKSTGWPWVNCGLGGIMSPNHTMNEADLVLVKPSENQNAALYLFHETEPFMKEELDRFFTGSTYSKDPQSYQRFVEDIKPLLSQLREKADNLISQVNFLNSQKGFSKKAFRRS